jgi:hypothetical protein
MTAKDSEQLAERMAQLAMEQAAMIQALTIALARTQFAVLELSVGDNKAAAEEVTKAHNNLMEESEGFHGRLKKLTDHLEELANVRSRPVD